MTALHRILTPLILLSFLGLTVAVTCVVNPGIPPQTTHCVELVSTMLAFSRRPGGSIPKRWGRNVENTPTSVHIPKQFWITGDGPRTCAVVVDSVFADFEVTEILTLSAVAFAAERILRTCVLFRGFIGLDQIGERQKIVVSIVRVDKDNGWRDGEGRLHRGNSSLRILDLGT